MFCSTASVAPFRQNIFFSKKGCATTNLHVTQLWAKVCFCSPPKPKASYRSNVPDLRCVETCTKALLQSRSGAWQRLKTSDPALPIALPWVKSTIKTHHAWVDPWKHRLRSWLSLSSRPLPRRWIEGQCSIDWHYHYMSGWLCQGTSGKFPQRVAKVRGSKFATCSEGRFSAFKRYSLNLKGSVESAVKNE